MNETPPPMHEPNASAAPTPRETLAGDRLCMRCLHPLAGRAIERDAQSGLLFVRCGECGTAAALFEYPTLAPWLGRLKSVVAGTLVVFALLTGLAMAGVATGFTIGTALECVDSAADALSASSIAAGNTDDGNGNFPGRWSSADTRWLATDAGRTALAETRWSPIVVLTLGARLGVSAISGLANASNALDGALGRLIGLVERYPELKANENALRLQEELVGTENRIAFARQGYNDAVMRLNEQIVVFPASLVANAFGIREMGLFEADASERAAVAVKF